MKITREITPVYINAEKVEFLTELVQAYFFLAFAYNENLMVNPDFLKKFTKKNFIEARVIINQMKFTPEVKMEAEEHKETIDRALQLLDIKIASF